VSRRRGVDPADTTALVVALALVLAFVAFWGAVIFVVVHFLAKVW
jgi:hypothetical protein